MNLTELKTKHPTLYNQLKQEGYKAGVKDENERLKAIDALNISGHKELVNKAKYETFDKAEQLAFNVVMAQQLNKFKR